MPSTFDLCEKFFATKDLYEIFDIPKDSLEKDVKKAYYKKALKVHPDRVKESDKEEATEKFKLLSRAYSILTNKSQRALYDEQGIIEDDEENICNPSIWLELWRKLFKPISVEDIDNYEKSYKFSELEKSDIKKAYIRVKGCINQMMDCVPFMEVADEPRIINIIKEMISSGDVPEYKIFTNEPKTKRDRRHKKYAREERESELIKMKLDKEEKEKEKETENLGKEIMKNQTKRENNSESFFDKLIAKYGGGNGSDEHELFDINACSSKKKKSTKGKTPTKKPINKTKTGRIEKTKITLKKNSK